MGLRKLFELDGRDVPSEVCMSLLQSMLELDPTKRITAAQALEVCGTGYTAPAVTVLKQAHCAKHGPVVRSAVLPCGSTQAA